MQIVSPSIMSNSRFSTTSLRGADKERSSAAMTPQELRAGLLKHFNVDIGDGALSITTQAQPIFMCIVTTLTGITSASIKANAEALSARMRTDPSECFAANLEKRLLTRVLQDLFRKISCSPSSGKQYLSSRSASEQGMISDFEFNDIACPNYARMRRFLSMAVHFAEATEEMMKMISDLRTETRQIEDRALQMEQEFDELEHEMAQIEAQIQEERAKCSEVHQQSEKCRNEMLLLKKTEQAALADTERCRSGLNERRRQLDQQGMELEAKKEESSRRERHIIKDMAKLAETISTLRSKYEKSLQKANQMQEEIRRTTVTIENLRSEAPNLEEYLNTANDLLEKREKGRQFQQEAVASRRRCEELAAQLEGVRHKQQSCGLEYERKKDLFIKTKEQAQNIEQDFKMSIAQREKEYSEANVTYSETKAEMDKKRLEIEHYRTATKTYKVGLSREKDRIDGAISQGKKMATNILGFITGVVDGAEFARVFDDFQEETKCG